MSYIKADNAEQQEYFDFLEELRQSGVVNMFGSPPYLQEAYDLPRDEAVSIVSQWMKAHSDDSRKMDKPRGNEKVKVEFVTKAKVTRRKRPRKSSGEAVVSGAGSE